MSFLYIFGFAKLRSPKFLSIWMHNRRKEGTIVDVSCIYLDRIIPNITLDLEMKEIEILGGMKLFLHKTVVINELPFLTSGVCKL